VGARAIARPHVGVGSNGTDCTTAHRWGRWTVVRCQLLIDPFKLKFDCLNMNLTI
jgi:hypothetical protein